MNINYKIEYEDNEGGQFVEYFENSVDADMTKEVLEEEGYTNIKIERIRQ